MITLSNFLYHAGQRISVINFCPKTITHACLNIILLETDFFFPCPSPWLQVKKNWENLCKSCNCLLVVCLFFSLFSGLLKNFWMLFPSSLTNQVLPLVCQQLKVQEYLCCQHLPNPWSLPVNVPGLVAGSGIQRVFSSKLDRQVNSLHMVHWTAIRWW